MSQPPVFLERRTYRRRRMMDAARLLPLFGLGLFLVPLLWPQANDSEPQVPMSDAFVYIFVVWAGLILVSGLLSRQARGWARTDSPIDPGSGDPRGGPDRSDRG